MYHGAHSSELNDVACRKTSSCLPVVGTAGIRLVLRMGLTMTKNSPSRTAIGLAILALLGAAPVFAQNSTENAVTGITKPSVHSKLGLNQLGIVRDLPVKEGQPVKKGDVLV